MAYRKVYFRIQAYAYGYDSGWSSEADEVAFDKGGWFPQKRLMVQVSAPQQQGN